MEKNINLKNYRKVHFVGVGGISQSAIAKYCLLNGIKVSGSDNKSTEITKGLKKMGGKIYGKHRAGNLKNSDAVIYTSAVDHSNPEIKRALKKRIPLIKRSQALNGALSGHKTVIGVSGSHGKTTATYMISSALVNANFNPTVFLGGECIEFDNFRLGDNNYAVAEVCEYKKNLLDITCNVAVILNIDNDHQESYESVSDQISAFAEFAKNAYAVVCADCNNLKNVDLKCKTTYAIYEKADFTAKYVSNDGGYYSFTAYKRNFKLGRINLSLKGKHNIYNALACIAVCDYLNLPFWVTAKTLNSLKGIKRRDELIGNYLGLPVYADYAHHPSEIASSIKNYGENALYIFQPHTYSRTSYLMAEFITALSVLNGLIIYKTYPAREKYFQEGSAKSLYNNLIIKNAQLSNQENFSCKSINYAGKIARLKSLIKRGVNGKDKIVFLGAGDVYDIAKKILKIL